MQAIGEYPQRLAAGLRQSLQEKSGALVLCDTFAPTPGEPPHGMMAARVAREAGFGGPIAALEFDDLQDQAQQARNHALAQRVQAWGEADDPAVIREQLYESILFTRLNTLQSATQRLLAAASAGVSQVAFNFSLGSSPAMCVTALLAMVQDPQARAQLSRAFGLEASPDGANLQTALVKMADQTSRDDRLVAARLEFAQTVREFEKGHNSVVVAAGNDGALPRQLLCPVPEDFTRSDLVTPETTVVGALENGKLAAYTSDPATVTVLADGAAYIPELQGMVHGTSFAAPRIAARLASIHGRFPELSSSEVEARL